MTITSQAKRAISKMKTAGFERNEFRVRTETRRFVHNGKKVTEYGDANITCWASKERQLEMIDAMKEAGLDVTVLVLFGEKCFPTIRESKNETGTLTLQEMIR